MLGLLYWVFFLFYGKGKVGLSLNRGGHYVMVVITVIMLQCRGGIGLLMMAEEEIGVIVKSRVGSVEEN